MPLARALVRRWGPHGAAVFAVAVSALLFGIAHLLPSPETPLPALSPAVAVQAMLKVVEGTAFGSLMGSLVVNSRWFAARDGAILRSLGFPMLLHAAFDLLYFAPILGLGFPLPDTYLTGNVLDELGMAASTLLLILAVFVAARSKKARCSALLYPLISCGMPRALFQLPSPVLGCPHEQKRSPQHTRPGGRCLGR